MYFTVISLSPAAPVAALDRDVGTAR